MLFGDSSGIDRTIVALKLFHLTSTRPRVFTDFVKLVEEPTAAAVDIRADYVAKNGAPSAAAPKIFFRYYYVNSSTGEKSGVMLAETTWTAGA